jgi:hypothetical protein
MLQFYRETAKKKPAHAEQTMQTVQKYTQVFRLLAVSKRAAACCAHASRMHVGWPAGLPAAVTAYSIHRIQLARIVNEGVRQPGPPPMLAASLAALLFMCVLGRSAAYGQACNADCLRWRCYACSSPAACSPSSPRCS